jgi:hypothetical protein
MLTPDHKGQNAWVSSDLLDQYETMGEHILDRIGDRDDTWVHHYDPDSKHQSMHSGTRIRRLSRNWALHHPVGGKNTCSIFGNKSAIFLVDIPEWVDKISFAPYVETLKKLKSRNERVRP